MNSSFPAQIEIDRLHVHLPPGSAAGGMLAPRLRLASLLQNAELHPAECSPSSILIVKHLHHTLSAARLDQPFPYADPSWSKSIRRELLHFFRAAARPARGESAAMASAVFFADEAEFMACAAREFAKGRNVRQWWWRHLLSRGRQSTPLEALGQWMCENAETVPAAMQLLTDWSEAGNVLNALSTRHIQQILQTVLHAYRLTGLAEAFASSSLIQSDGDEIHPPARVDAPVFRKHTTGVAPMAAHAPWFRQIPSVTIPAGLDRGRATLLGISLLLHRRPGLFSNAEFRQQLKYWLADRDDDRQEASSRTPLHSDRASMKQDRELQEPSGDSIASVELSGRIESPPPAEGARTPKVFFHREESRPESSPHPAGVDSESPAAADRAAESRRDDSRAPGASRPERGAEEETRPHAVEAGEQSGRTGTDGGHGAETRLAGTFYLINLMTALELPECFEDGWQLASQTGSWGVLEIITRALTAEEPLYETDPIWRVLQKLDGREPGEPPRAPIHAAEETQLPQKWLAMIPPTATELRFLHVRDHPDDSLKTVPIFESSGEEHGSLKRWLDLVMPFIRWRLAAALDVSPDNKTLRNEILLTPGRVYVTSSHVDVMMTLADIRLPLRMAGLDRDPGWLPNFGRVVLFHYQGGL